ncbi:hypothetical protein O3G_MSEX012406 [Manduca sexta]|uniref:Cell growth-regulating nucleolar protein n=2 Tax=Manduca sexta TaxID=7130 RepID=A0A921ZNL3_MANSE|nr:hypothetical protein O3G_MSEX012406 [Manduca sexta]KAG6461057.1 hypothetical protein O3G_MSEX012406 [Manduca sexta]
MVVFTCGYCGESVQKPKVEKHYMTKCRNMSPNLSCMDCFKDFLGQDYVAHNKCITEEERYSGKGFTPKEKKGEKKQSVWVDMLQSVLDEQKNMPKNVQRIIESISKHQNTPRKKPKFINFVKNVCGNKTNPKDIDQAWDMISVKLADLAKATQNNNKKQNITTNGTDIQENGDKDTQDNSNTDTQEKNTDKSDNILKASNTNVTVEAEDQNDETELNNGEVNSDKKLSKKQRKEEKKRKKYEAELKSAVAPPEEPEVVEGKKEKKKKNRTDSVNGNTEEHGAGKKQKKRKRQDTVNSVNGAPEPVVNEVENQENEVVKEKTKKKKLKIDGTEEAEESICLHDQNVATIEESGEQNGGKFNWHAVIMSVLEKKGNEVPFKRLQKKVLSEYTEATGREVDDRIAEKFIKKLKSAPNVRVDKNRVLLIE